MYMRSLPGTYPSSDIHRKLKLFFHPFDNYALITGWRDDIGTVHNMVHKFDLRANVPKLNWFLYANIPSETAYFGCYSIAYSTVTESFFITCFILYSPVGQYKIVLSKYNYLTGNRI